MIVYTNKPGVFSFFNTFPQILLRVRGSVVPELLPQILLSVAITTLFDFLDFSLSPAPFRIIAFPIAFLLVYRSSGAYVQYWEGRTQVEEMTRALKAIAMQVNASLRPRKGRPDPEAESKEVLATRDDVFRWLKLYMFLTVENLQSETTEHSKHTIAGLERLERMHECLVTPEERAHLARCDLDASLYCQGKALVVLMWCQRAITHAADVGRMGRFQLHSINRNFNDVATALAALDKINQTPFPFPLAQMIAVYEILFTTFLPAALLQSVGRYAYFFSALVTVAYFGIDAIATGMESPFGFEDNDLDLQSVAYALVRELDILALNRRFRLVHSVEAVRGLERSPHSDPKAVEQTRASLLEAWTESVKETFRKGDMDVLRSFDHVSKPDQQHLQELGVDFRAVARNLGSAEAKLPDKGFLRRASFLPRRLSSHAVRFVFSSPVRHDQQEQQQ